MGEGTVAGMSPHHISDVSGKPRGNSTGSPPDPDSRASNVNPLVLILLVRITSSPSGLIPDVRFQEQKGNYKGKYC
ncbi:MAG: hypothetical protein GX654_10685 [Desulfatiglans sp.]|nr:hypothetical protein [Desulfatiglans sp.]